MLLEVKQFIRPLRKSQTLKEYMALVEKARSDLDDMARKRKKAITQAKTMLIECISLRPLAMLFAITVGIGPMIVALGTVITLRMIMPLVTIGNSEAALSSEEVGILEVAKTATVVAAEPEVSLETAVVNDFYYDNRTTTRTKIRIVVTIIESVKM
ncbi:hypothetical protein GGR58DRAFT_506312 [Xylaria digitata]|nr:hypothetical protein GGR58DRAFT_506312 [Xylaria digitata]